MTVIKIIGEKNKPIGKKIEFIGQLDCCLSYDTCCSFEPQDYNYIDLICLNYNGYDLMLAYTDPNNRGLGVLYTGNFNDGIV